MLRPPVMLEPAVCWEPRAPRLLPELEVSAEVGLLPGLEPVVLPLPKMLVLPEERVLDPALLEPELVSRSIATAGPPCGSLVPMPNMPGLLEFVLGVSPTTTSGPLWRGSLEPKMLPLEPELPKILPELVEERVCLPPLLIKLPELELPKILLAPGPAVPAALVVPL